MKQAVDRELADAEIAVLACAMLDGRELARCTLDATDFVSVQRALIFGALLHLWRSGTAIEILTVRAELVRQGALDRIGGDDALLALTETIPNVENVEHYASIVRDASMRRRLREHAQRVAAYASSSRSLAELRDDVAQLTAILDRHDTSRTEMKTIGSSASAAIDDARERGERDESTTITTGLPALDAYCDGWDRGDLIAIGGDSGAGKSTTMLYMARAQAQAGERVLIVSLEDAELRWGRRAVAASSGVSVRALKRGPWSGEQTRLIDKGLRSVQAENVWGAYPLGGTIDEVLAAIRQAVYVLGVTVVYVDYLQAFDAGDDDSELRHLIRRWLTALRREAASGLVVLVGSQYRKREDDTKRPKDSDLYEAAYIRQKCDAIVHVWRDADSGRRWFMSKHKDVDPVEGILLRDEATGLLARAASEQVTSSKQKRGQQQAMDYDAREFRDDDEGERWRAGL